MRGRLPYGPGQRQKLAERDLERSWIPEAFWNVSLEAIPDGLPHKAKVSKYIGMLDDHVRDGIGLVLAGPYGSGKTSAAVAIALEVMARGGSCRFITEPRMVNAILGKEREDEDWTFERRLREVMMLVLDDVGMCSFPGGINIVEEVLNERIQHLRPTILTTNLGPKDFDARYPSLAERIRGRFLWVAFGGINWREAQAKELQKRF